MDIKVDALASLASWRLNQPITAGKVRQGRVHPKFMVGWFTLPATA